MHGKSLNIKKNHNSSAFSGIYLQNTDDNGKNTQTMPSCCNGWRCAFSTATHTHFTDPSWLEKRKHCMVVLVTVGVWSIRLWCLVMRKRSSSIPDVLQRGTAVQVLPDGVVVDGGSKSHEHVPDGVSERDHTVWFEEDDTQAVDQASERQLVQPVCVTLTTSRSKQLLAWKSVS